MKSNSRTREEQRPKVKMKVDSPNLNLNPNRLASIIFATLMSQLIVLSQLEQINCDNDARIGLDDNFAEEISSYQRPRFAPLAPEERRVVASQWQSEVFLPCRILNLDEDQTVSWIRKRDSLVMTIDKLNLVNDQRFQLAQSEQNWTLVVKQPSEEDAGLYECQVSSVEPKLSQLIELQMVSAESRISNFSSLYIRPNEQINLTCTIEAPQRTDFVYWYKNKESIHFDDLRHLTANREANSSEDSRGRRVGRSLDSSIVSVSLPAQNQDANRSTNLQEHPARRKLANGSPLNRKEEEERELEDISQQRDNIASETRSRRKLKQQYKSSASRPREQQSPQNEDNEKIEFITSVSRLVIERAQANDTANYTCLPSNAKPSHINIVVVVENNGLQSQPEKRSLQADGAISSFRSEWYHLSGLIAQQLVTRLQVAVDWTLELVIGQQIDHSDKRAQIYSANEQNLTELLRQLTTSQELLRLLAILIITLYINL